MWLSSRGRLGIFLLAVFAGSLLANLRWIETFGFFPHMADEAFHLLKTLQYRQLLLAQPANLYQELQVQMRAWGYPPLVNLVAALWWIISGGGLEQAMLSLTLFVLPLALGVALVGRHLRGSWGLLAAVITLSLPLVLSLQRYFLLDFPLMAMTWLCIGLLLESRNFRRLQSSLAFGISFGLALLTKWSVVFFLLPLGGVALWRRLRSPGPRNLWPAILAFALAAFIMSFYVYPWEPLMAMLQPLNPGLKPMARVETSPLSFEGLLYYPISLWYQLTPPLAVLFLGLLPFALRSGGRQLKALYWSGLFSLLLLVLIPNKWGRYAMPLLPLAALSISQGLGVLRRSWRRAAAALLVLWSLASYLVLSFDHSLQYYHHSFMYSLQVPAGRIAVRSALRDLPALAAFAQDTDSACRTVCVVDVVPRIYYADALRVSFGIRHPDLKVISFPEQLPDFLAQWPSCRGLVLVSPHAGAWPDSRQLERFRQSHDLDYFLGDFDLQRHEALFAILRANFLYQQSQRVQVDPSDLEAVVGMHPASGDGSVSFHLFGRSAPDCP